MKDKDIIDAISKMPDDMAQEMFQMFEVYKKSLTVERAADDFMLFVNEMWPGFIHGRHHELMAEKFEQIAKGEIKRLIINMPPRHTKSEFASFLLPAWYLGKYPGKKIIQTSNTAELAVGFGRKVRNLVASEQYHRIFPFVNLRSDSKAAGRWSTNSNGEYLSLIHI